ncbi:phage holin family protein [Limnobacter sp.]|uniref:phage holin family protein n=1 Tax=Limnobacter sp. TaxID=2003368 RepID=UPI002FE0E8FC
MLNSNARAALKRVAASLLGMGQTRLELAGVELAQARQTTVRTVLWSVLTALAVAFATLFVCVLVVALAWDTHRFIAIAGCAAFYVVLAVYFYVQLKDMLAAQPPLFEATIAELGRDKNALLESLSDDNRRGPQ